jgi:hypothetical protein
MSDAECAHEIPLPAPSGPPIASLQSGRLTGRNYQIYKALLAICRSQPGFSLLSGKTGAGRHSARQALGARRDVVKGQRHRHAGVKAHQADHVGDALMAERLDRAVEETLGDPA